MAARAKPERSTQQPHAAALHGGIDGAPGRLDAGVLHEGLEALAAFPHELGNQLPNRGRRPRPALRAASIASTSITGPAARLPAEPHGRRQQTVVNGPVPAGTRPAAFFHVGAPVVPDGTDECFAASRGMAGPFVSRRRQWSALHGAIPAKQGLRHH
jgi:hypothetical protein